MKPRILTFTNSPNQENGFQGVVTAAVLAFLVIALLVVLGSVRDLETNYRNNEAEHGEG